MQDIVCGDATVILPSLKDSSVDLILTDPPYNIGLKYDKYSDSQKDEIFWSMIKSVYAELFRVLKDKKHLVFTCAQKQIWIYRPMLEEMGFSFRHLGVWSNPRRKAGSWPGQWPYAWEAILDFTKGGFQKLNNKNCVGYQDVWIEEPPKKIKHPAKRPVKCWTDLLLLTSNENDLVIDPYLGSGSTTLVAHQNNRQYLGIDISEDYCKLAKKRINEISIPHSTK